eukprot:1568060-Rhodomonas_salina.3
MLSVQELEPRVVVFSLARQGFACAARTFGEEFEKIGEAQYRMSNLFVVCAPEGWCSLRFRLTPDRNFARTLPSWLDRAELP